MKSTTVFSTLAALLLTTAVALGQDPLTAPKHPMEAPYQRLMMALNLTDEQKKEVETIHFDAAKQAIATRSKIATANLEFRQLLHAENPDKAAIEKKISEIAQFKTQVVQTKIGNWFTINKLLTPEQQKVWKRALQIAVAKHQEREVRRHFARPGVRERMQHDDPR